jgi:hypothetical protein
MKNSPLENREVRLRGLQPRGSRDPAAAAHSAISACASLDGGRTR